MVLLAEGPVLYRLGGPGPGTLLSKPVSPGATSWPEVGCALASSVSVALAATCRCCCSYCPVTAGALATVGATPALANYAQRRCPGTPPYLLDWAGSCFVV